MRRRTLAPELTDSSAQPPARRAANHGRARAVAAVAFLSTGLSVGMTSYGFGAFVEPLEREFGWSRAQINAGFSIGFVTALAAPPAGALIDRMGPRKVMFASLLIMSAGMLLRAHMTELWHWYALSALVALGLTGSAMLPAGKLVGIWFPKTRGRVMGTVASGNNLGGAIVVPLATWLIALSGWEMVFTVFGVALAALSVLVVIVVRDRPTDAVVPPATSAAAGGAISVRAALKMPVFYLLAGGLTASAFTHPLMVTQLQPHFENEGLSRGLAAALLTVSALTSLSSKIVMGWLSERITARNATIISLLTVSCGIGLLIIAGGSWAVWPAVLVFGLGLGGFGALRSLVVQEAFGIRAFGGIMGAFNLMTILPIASGPLIAGFTFDATGGYAMAFGTAIAIFLIGAAFLAAAGKVGSRLPGIDAEAGAR